MARKATNPYEKIAELDAKIESHKAKIKELTAKRNALKESVMKQEFGELAKTIKSKNVDMKQVIDYVNNL